MRRVIVESPFAGKDNPTGFAGAFERAVQRKIETTANILYARAAVRDAVLRGEAPIASHLLLTQPGILNDEIPEERHLGIEAGLAWRGVADASVVYVDRGISGGMRYGMDLAAETGLPSEQRSLPGTWSTAALVPWPQVISVTGEAAQETFGDRLNDDDALRDIASALLHARGWGFFQTGPDEGDWLKFTDDQSRAVARGGDRTWAEEYAEARAAAEHLARDPSLAA